MHPIAVIVQIANTTVVLATSTVEIPIYLGYWLMMNFTP
jgi:hypothetical protein